MPPTITYAPTTNVSKASKSVYTRPQKKATMSVTQTYFLAHSARGKLSQEASRPDHNLRLLVGHANMLDSLMIDLANAEQEQEKWFSRTVLGVDTEESEDEEEEEEQIEIYRTTTIEEPTANWPAEKAQAAEVDDDDDEGENLELVHTTSSNSPPELTTSDSDSDSDDEQSPPSPENAAIDAVTLAQRQALVTSSYYEDKKQPAPETVADDGTYLPSRSQTTVIAAY